MDLEEIRERIDDLDGRIVDLLNQRMSLAYFTRKFKTGIQDVAREKELLKRLTDKANSCLGDGFLNEVYKMILNKSRNNQKENLQLIGYWGNFDETTEKMIWEWNGKQGVVIPFKTTRNLFDNIRENKLDYGVIPLRAGMTEMDLTIKEWLMTSGLFICEKVFFQREEFEYNEFIVIKKEKEINGGENCAVCFSIIDKVGSLYNMIQVMNKFSLNIRNIDSIPFQANSKMFFIDFSHNLSDNVFSKALDEIKSVSVGYKFLGAYKETRVEKSHAKK